MTGFSLAAVFADAAALWRRERALLMPVAAMFLLVPTLATRLFVFPHDPPPANPDAASQAMLQFYQGNWPWLLVAVVVELFGSGALLVLLLDRTRPTVAEALARMLRQLPALLLAWIMMLALAGLGSMLLLLPGLYVIGRTFLVWPVLLAEPGRGPGEALIEGIARTHKRGWLLLGVLLIPLAASILAGGVVEGFEDALPDGMGGDVVRGLFDLAGAAIGAGGLLAQVLLQAAAYRLITARQGT